MSITIPRRTYLALVLTLFTTHLFVALLILKAGGNDPLFVTGGLMGLVIAGGYGHHFVKTWPKVPASGTRSIRN